MIAVRYHDKVNVLGTLKNSISSPFDRVQWFELAAGAATGTPQMVVAETAGAMMALPLIERNGRLESLVNWYSFSWRPLASGGSAASLAEAMAADLRRRTGRVTLWPLPDEDGAASLLEQCFRKAGWIVTREKCDDNHILRLSGRDYAQYLTGRPGALRTTLKRKASRVSATISTYFDPLEWDTYEKIYAGSWKPPEGDSRLLRAFAMDEGAAGRLRLGIARHEGRPVAAQFWTVEAGTAWIHKLAHLEEAQPLSAGTTLSAALFEHVIDRDQVSLVDFGTGNDPYKRDWMEECRPRFRLDGYNPSRPGSWPRIARAMLARLRRGAGMARGPS